LLLLLAVWHTRNDHQFDNFLLQLACLHYVCNATAGSALQMTGSAVHVDCAECAAPRAMASMQWQQCNGNNAMASMQWNNVMDNVMATMQWQQCNGNNALA